MAQEGNGPSIIANLNTDDQNENVREEMDNKGRQSEDNQSCEADHVDPGGQCERRPNGSEDSDPNDNGQNAVEMQSTTLGPSVDAAGSEQTNYFGDGELSSSVSRRTISSITVTQCQSPLDPSAFVSKSLDTTLGPSGDAAESEQTNVGQRLSISNNTPSNNSVNTESLATVPELNLIVAEAKKSPSSSGDAQENLVSSTIQEQALQLMQGSETKQEVLYSSLNPHVIQETHQSNQPMEAAVEAAVEMQCTTLGPSGDAAGSEQTNDVLGKGLNSTSDVGQELLTCVSELSLSNNTPSFANNSVITKSLAAVSEINQIVEQCQSPSELTSHVLAAAKQSPSSSGDAQKYLAESSTIQKQVFQLMQGSETKQEVLYSRLNPHVIQETHQSNQPLEAAAVPSAAGDAPGTSEQRTKHPVIPHRLPDTVRDASLECGQRDADEAYKRLFLEYYPEYKNKVYRVPPLFIGHPPYVSSRKSEDLQSQSSEDFQLYGTTRSDVRGDAAEKLVAKCVEDLLTSWFMDPAFVITSFQFENFCNKIDIPPSTDKNKFVDNENSENTAPKHKDGEHDLLVVHYKYGIIFVQVKSCEETTDPNNTVKKAIEQTQADEAFFTSNFDDLKTGVSIQTAIALPDNMKSELEHSHKNCLKRIKTYYADGLGRCLFKEDLPCKTDSDDILEEKKKNLVKWWECITKSCDGFKSFDDYKRVVARYIGFKSTVKIPVTVPPSSNAEVPEGRRLSHCVSVIGNRYMNIVLTPQQVYILNTNLPRLIIRGQYGTGKTVLLILKARELMKQLKKVCIISMSHSPLIHVLEQSIKYDIHPAYYDKISFETALDQSELTRILKTCSDGRCNVLIDEFPSFISENKLLQKTIQDYPSGLMFWCVMSRERNDRMSRGPQRLFSLFHQTEFGFREAVMEKILRSPPSVQLHVPQLVRRSEKRILEYHGNNLESEITKSLMAGHFHSLGLSTPQTRQLMGTSPPVSSVKWSDIVVLEPEPPSRQLYSYLVKLKVPLLRVSNLVQYSKTNYDEIKSGLSNKSAYTCSTEGFPNAQPVADIAGTKYEIYLNGSKKGQVVQLDNTLVAVARFLHENGFINDHITTASEIVQSQRKLKPRRWCDVIFVDRGDVKPACYSFLESLGVPLVTPSSIHDVMTNNAVLYTNRSNFEGFQRRESITFDKGKAISNAEEKICVEGPETKYLNHTSHEGCVEACNLCKDSFQRILHELGLKIANSMQPVDQGRALRPATLGTGAEQNRFSVQTSEMSGLTQNLLALAKDPRHDLSFADLVILDERQNPQSAVDLFKRCGVPVHDKLDSDELDEEEAFGSATKVLYIKPYLFKGLEKKVVVIIKSQNQRVVPMIKGGITEDSIELAITRCASQLIVILTN